MEIFLNQFRSQLVYFYNNHIYFNNNGDTFKSRYGEGKLCSNMMILLLFLLKFFLGGEFPSFFSSVGPPPHLTKKLNINYN